MTTNINNVIDPFNRYKRPSAIITIKNNKTTIQNIVEIAQSLHTKAPYIMYFIQLDKSVPTTAAGEIKSSMTKIDVENLLNAFIEKYIICKQCGLPELVIRKETKNLYFSCDSCGKATDIAENKFTKIIYKDYK